MTRSVQVLVLDDDPTMGVLYSIAFQKQAAKVTVVEDQAAAERFFEQCTPDLFLVDLWLGQTNGLEAAEQILQRTGQTVPLVAVTASPSEILDVYVSAHRCSGYLTKPIQLATFAASALAFIERTETKPGQAPESLQAPHSFELGRAFLRNAVNRASELSAMSDTELMENPGLAQAAHRWVGASGIDCVPQVECEARQLERLARLGDLTNIADVRSLLQGITEQFKTAALNLGTDTRHAERHAPIFGGIR